MESFQKKKEYCKTRPTAGKGCMLGRLHADCDRSPTRPCGGPHTARGRIFQCFWVPFRRPFGQCWALLAPFQPLLAPCWALLAPFQEHFGRSWLIFARNKQNLESIFAGGFFTKNLVAKRQKKSNPRTTKRQTHKQARRYARSRLEYHYYYLFV